MKCKIRISDYSRTKLCDSVVGLLLSLKLTLHHSFKEQRQYWRNTSFKEQKKYWRNTSFKACEFVITRSYQNHHLRCILQVRQFPMVATNWPKMTAATHSLLKNKSPLTAPEDARSAFCQFLWEMQGLRLVRFCERCRSALSQIFSERCQACV